MSHAEFIELHMTSVTSMRAYFVEIEKTSAMLAECTEEPLPLEKRLVLTSQSVIEQEAHLTYLGTKTLLLDAARFGYGYSN